MPRVLLALLVVGLTVYALVDCIRTDAAHVRRLPKALWVLVIVLIVLIGPLAWLVAGRGRPAARSALPEPPRPVAPDDDPGFLRDLDLERWRREHGDGDDPPRA